MKEILIDRPYLESRIKLPGHPWKYLPPEALVQKNHYQKSSTGKRFPGTLKEAWCCGKLSQWDGGALRRATLMTNSNRKVEVNPMLLLIQYPTYIDKSWFIVPPKVSIHCSPSDETKHCCLSCGYQTIWGYSNHVKILSTHRMSCKGHPSYFGL